MSEKNGGVDKLSQNYNEMNETGKEKLKEVSEKIFDIWNSMNKKSNQKMTDDHKKMWSILIGVLKNRDREHYKIEDILEDICDIRSLIDKLEV